MAKPFLSSISGWRGSRGVILGLPAVAPGMRLAGRAMCVLQMTGPAGAFPGSDFKVGIELCKCTMTVDVGVGIQCQVSSANLLCPMPM